jgi:hypothetical protein
MLFNLNILFSLTKNPSSPILLLFSPSLFKGFILIEARISVSWRSFHEEGNEIFLPLSSLPLLVCFSSIILLMFIVILLWIFTSMFHAWRKTFHGGTSMTKVMTFLFPFPPSFLFYFSFTLLI